MTIDSARLWSYQYWSSIVRCERVWGRGLCCDVIHSILIGRDWVTFSRVHVEVDGTGALENEKDSTFISVYGKFIVHLLLRAIRRFCLISTTSALFVMIKDSLCPFPGSSLSIISLPNFVRFGWIRRKRIIDRQTGFRIQNILYILGFRISIIDFYFKLIIRK